MYKVTKYPHGTFSWADCSTSDWSAGKQFYSEIMGWESEDLPIGEGQFYTMFKQDGENVGAISQIQPEMKEQGIPSHWNTYITVDDVDALVEKVKLAGGTIIAEPFDVLEAGRQMIIQDTTGATVSLWQAKDSIGAGLVNTVGAMLWNELMTREPDKAKEFYSELLGWEFQQDGTPGYDTIVNKGRMNGAIMTLGEEYGDAPSTWMVYYNVADIDVTLEKIKAKGGAIHVQAEAEGVGKFAFVADAQGATFYVMQAKMIDTWEEK